MTTNLVPVASIELDGAGRKVSVATFAEADRAIAEMVGETEIRYVLIYQDGFTYAGKIAHGEGLAAHLRHFLEVMAGVKRPRGVTSMEYRAQLEEIDLYRPGQRAECRRFLETYEIGDVPKQGAKP